MPPNQKQPTREEFIQSLFLLQPKDNITPEKEARKKLVAGVDKVVDVIKASYGSAGSNCILEAGLYPFHEAVNDGKKIVDSIYLADPIENIGANIVKEVASKSDKESGDGRKTSMILLQAILEEGMKCEAEPMEIKRSLDECLPIIIKSIDDQTKQITTSEVGRVAAVASENEKLGKTFQEIYEKIGKDGIVELDNSGTPETFYEITDGVRLLNCRFMYDYMANDDKGRKAVYNFPKVLITKEKIGNSKILDGILKECFNKGLSELVIFCDDIDPNVSSAVAYLHNGINSRGEQVTPFRTLVIKAPVLWKDWLFEDFAKITGATVVNPTEGRQLKNFQFNWLGYCDKIISSKYETVVLGTKNIDEHLSVLEDIGTDDSKIRISRLKTKTAILKLGANSETELSYIKGKALDARNSSYLALNGGVVAGAGFALDEAGATLPDSIGGNILDKALQYPMKQIRQNMGNKDGYLKEEVWDSAIVVKNAITNALSVASTILTTKNVITLKK